MSEKDAILKIRDLRVSFKTDEGIVNAVRGVDLDLAKGETTAIVGESGCGKSVTVKAIMGILSSNQKIDRGSIEFSYDTPSGKVEVDLLKLSPRRMQKEIKGKRISMVFQDPMTSLDPTMTIGKQLSEGVMLHQGMSRREARERSLDLLRLVNMDEPEKRLKNYPHQLSGGMRQRVVIAIALACDPEVLICDEPTTALDVTTQARILELIKDIRNKTGVSVIFITHNLGVVAKIADSVNVMYAGRIVESGTSEDIFYDPRHPYTWGLLSSVPGIDVAGERLYSIPGNPPNLRGEITGDPFAPRNPYALNIDFREEPPMFEVGGAHRVASWLAHPDAPRVDPPRDLIAGIKRMMEETHERVE